MDLTELNGIIISQEKALKIIKQHGNASFSELKDFIQELGNRHEYEAIKIYYWLGY